MSKLSEHEKTCVTCKHFFIRIGKVKTNRCGAPIRLYDSAHRERGSGMCQQLGNYTNKEEEKSQLKNENERLRIALADAIRRPMGVVPDSAIEFLKENKG